jgi:hypothetical protein
LPNGLALGISLLRFGHPRFSLLGTLQITTILF